MEDIKHKMKISEAIRTGNVITENAVYNPDAYRPAKTLASNPRVWAVQDSALQTSGAYTLVAHAVEMGLAGFGSQFMGYAALSGLTQDGLIAACVNTLANDMTREFIELYMSGDDDDEDGDTLVADIEEDLIKHKIRKKFNTAAKWVQQFGGCQLFIDTGTDDPEDLSAPLSHTEIINNFRGFVLVEPINTSPGEYNTTNPLSPDYFKPKYWWVMAQQVHASRLIILSGDEPATLLKPSYNFYGIPHVQRLYDAVLHFKQNMQAAGRLLNKFSCTIFKTNLDGILDGGSIDELDKRLMLFTRNRSNDGVLAIDFENEDITIQQTSISGVRDLVQQSLEYVAALDRKPAVKLLGLSPSGFNTGDADIDNYYDSVAAQQEEMFKEPLQRVIEVLQVARYRVVNENLVFKFVELSEEDELQAANVRKIEADTGGVLITNGVISPEEERARIKMSENSGYDNLEGDLDIADNPDDVELANIIAGLLKPEEPQTVSDEWNEEDHPRKGNGEFSSGGADSINEEAQRKIDSVNIDFDNDNILQGLNIEDLEALGKQDKPVLLKKNIIEKNLKNHPEVSKADYNQIIGQSLYKPDSIFSGHISEPRFNFVSRVGDNKSTITLLEMAETKKNYEIINLHWISDRQRSQKEKNGIGK